MSTLLLIGFVLWEQGLKGVSKELSVLPLESLNSTLMIGFVSDFHISSDGRLIFLDRKMGKVYEANLDGIITKTYGQMGPGPNELGKVNNFTAIDDDLWIPDESNGTIKVAHQGQVNGFKSENINMPRGVLQVGTNVYVTGLSLSNGVDVYDTSGKHLSHLKLSLPDREKTSPAGIWNSGTLFKAPGSKIAFGFQYDNRLMVWDLKGKEQRNKTMEAFYAKFETQEGGEFLPKGFSARGFSAGPQGSYFILTCSLKALTCQTLIQVSGDLSHLIGQRDLPEKVIQIRYYPDHGMLGLLDINNTLFLYEAE